MLTFSCALDRDAQLFTSVYSLPLLQICGYDVPKGCVVCLPPYAIDNSEANYGEDAREFRPERYVFCPVAIHMFMQNAITN